MLVNHLKYHSITYIKIIIMDLQETSNFPFLSTDNLIVNTLCIIGQFWPLVDVSSLSISLSLRVHSTETITARTSSEELPMNSESFFIIAVRSEEAPWLETSREKVGPSPVYKAMLCFFLGTVFISLYASAEREWDPGSTSNINVSLPLPFLHTLKMKSPRTCRLWKPCRWRERERERERERGFRRKQGIKQIFPSSWNLVCEIMKIALCFSCISPNTLYSLS